MKDDVTTARANVEEQLLKVRAIASSAPAAAVERDTAILHALTARESAELTNHIASESMRALEIVRKTLVATSEDLGSKIEAVATLMAESEKHLAGRIDAFTTATDASTRKLADWTKVMAIATAALVLTSVAQIAVAVLAWLKPHP
jgi:hypothetical protein